MNSLRVPLIVLAVVYALLALFGLAMSTFANGGLWERIPLLLHPLAVVSLLWLLFTARPTPTLAGVTLALLLLGIIGSLASSGAILSGLTRGDWRLPLVWAVVPLISLPYVISFLGGRREDAPGFAA